MTVNDPGTNRLQRKAEVSCEQFVHTILIQKVGEYLQARFGCRGVSWLLTLQSDTRSMAQSWRKKLIGSGPRPRGADSDPHHFFPPAARSVRLTRLRGTLCRMVCL